MAVFAVVVFEAVLVITVVVVDSAHVHLVEVEAGHGDLVAALRVLEQPRLVSPRAACSDGNVDARRDGEGSTRGHADAGAVPHDGAAVYVEAGDDFIGACVEAEDLTESGSGD